MFNGLTPTAVTYYAAPVKTATRQQKVGFYAQDQWTIDRLTLNLGVRFDYLKGSVPALDVPAGTWVPERHFGAVSDIPNWKDWTPRVGAVYNLFGNGKTAIKGFVGRYVTFEAITGLTALNGPANRLVNTATRNWSDNGDYIPQESELGPLSDGNFGKVVSHDHLFARPADGESAVQLAGVAAGPAGARTGAGAQRRLFPHVVREPARDQ